MPDSLPGTSGPRPSARTAGPLAATTRSPHVDPLRQLGPPRRGCRARSLESTLRAYVALTKPRIVELLLVTTVPAMILAAGRLPPLGLVVLTLAGGTLAAGSANTLNCYFDRDIDVRMRRTARRPLPAGAVSPREALVLGLVLGVLAVALLALAVHGLAALLALTGIGVYVVGYTLVLKRRTAQNIVWGGAAGCMPVLVGWAAVRGSLDWTPVVLFAVVFFWTPPHYWPLALRFRSDYAAAGVPMLPVVAPERLVTGRIVAYSWGMVAASLLLWPVAPTGPIYAVSAVVLGGAFLLEAHRLHARAGRGMSGTGLAPMRLFHWSIAYLTLLFLAVAVDQLLAPVWTG